MVTAFLYSPAEHLPERTAQTCYFHMSIHFLSSIIYAKESDILWSKPNVVSVCEGVHLSLFPVKLQLYVVTLWLPFYLNDTNTRRVRCATRKLRQCHVHLYHNCIYAKRARHVPEETL